MVTIIIKIVGVQGSNGSNRLELRLNHACSFCEGIYRVILYIIAGTYDCSYVYTLV